MEKVDGIHVEAFEGIVGVSGDEDDARAGGHAFGEVDAAMRMELYVEKHDVGHGLLHARHAFDGRSEAAERDAAKAFAVFLNDAQGDGLVVYGYAFNHGFFY